MAAAAIAAAAVGACSITVGYDGFVGPGGAGDGGRDEASLPATPEPDGGASQDEAIVDAGVEAEAPDPNGPPRFVDGGSFCSKEGAAATFCEDFDTHDLSARWIREGVFSRLTSYSPKSAPNVLLIDVPPTSTGGTFVSKITREFEQPSTDLLFEFDLKPESVNTASSFFILAALEWSRGDAKYSLRFVYSSGVVRLEESNLVPPPNNTDAYHPFFSIPMDEWTRVGLDVVLSGSDPRAQVLLDGEPVGARLSLSPTPDLDPRPTLILGAVFAGNPHTGWTLRYDDVSLDLR